MCSCADDQLCSWEPIHGVRAECLAGAEDIGMSRAAPYLEIKAYPPSCSIFLSAAGVTVKGGSTRSMAALYES